MIITMKPSKIQKIKKILQAGGAFFTALGGLMMGILSILKIFYPDPTPQPTPVTSTILK